MTLGETTNTKDIEMYENELADIKENEIREAVKREIENILDNMQYDDEIEMPEFYAIEIFCECQRCQRGSYNPERWRQMHVIDGMVVKSECRDRIAEKKRFEELTDQVEALFEELEYDYDYTIANTGTRYYTISREEREYKIRVADHGECYCSEDYSVDLSQSGTTLDQLREILSCCLNDSSSGHGRTEITTRPLKTTCAIAA